MGYTIHVVCKMTHRGDCGDAGIAVPLQRRSTKTKNENEKRKKVKQ